MQACPRCARAIEGDFAFCPYCGAELGAAGGFGQRKTVTALFCDVAGSTSLGESIDPEALRALLARYFERMGGIVEAHGGVVEKFIGDAVVAFFGIPVAHEDDALRAVRAAVEMREALPQLGVRARIGVNTGEVVTAKHESLATGDAVNVAARLEQAAQPNEILIGEPTLALVRRAVEVEAVEPLTLRGKSQPVPAYRLLSVREAPERPHDAMFIGRRRELALVREAWERARSEQRCELVTVVGDAGVGKSRLAAEFLAGIEGEALYGRCLPYGEGITYSPVVEVVKQLDVLPPEPAVAAPIQSLLGKSDAVTSADEIAWGFRKTLEHAAAERPLVVVFDDIQWGEQAFLDLIEHVALLSSGLPLLLLCLARPELSERRPAWLVTLRLEPLGDDDVEKLIGERVSAGAREKITRAAGGNPLFVQEMLAMAGEARGEVTVPPTLWALLAARLDQLDGTERGVLERGAVEGELFHRGAVQALAADGQVTPRLAALVRKGLIMPDRPELRGEDAFRFRHLLIRDAAYASLPKGVRAELHERFAAWLVEHGAELVELDELVGYHLEQACRYRAELGMPADERLRAAARGRLSEAGRRADARHDYAAAANLRERAISFVPEGQLDLGLEFELAEALWGAGRGDDAVRHANAITERGAALRDRIAELCGQVLSGRYRTFLEPEGATEPLQQLLNEALPVFEDSGDDVALFIGYSALGHVANGLSKGDDAVRAFDRAAVHARRAGTWYESRLFIWRALFRLLGSVPVPAFLSWLDEQESSGVQALTLKRFRAAALARLGRFEEARALLAEHFAELRDRGNQLDLAACLGFHAIEVELLGGDPAAAIKYGEEACAILEEIGQQSLLSTAAGLLATALCEAASFDEGEAWARRAAGLGAADDVATQFLWRQAMEKVIAQRGEHAEAERLAREAVAFADGTDDLEQQANIYVNLAEVLSFAGRTHDAAEALTEALGRYERKGVVVMAARAREGLEALREAAGAAK